MRRHTGLGKTFGRSLAEQGGSVKRVERWTDPGREEGGASNFVSAENPNLQISNVR